MENKPIDFHEQLVAESKHWGFNIPEEINSPIAYMFFIVNTETLSEFDKWMDKVIVEESTMWLDDGSVHLFRTVAGHLAVYHEYKRPFLMYAESMIQLAEERKMLTE